MTRAAVVAVLAVSTATPAFADHPGPFRVEGMSPLMTALLTGGLAFLVALVVVVVIMVLTRRARTPNDPRRPQGPDARVALSSSWCRDAAAHAVLVKSSPARRAALGRRPRASSLFNERLEPAYSTVSVWASGNDRVDDARSSWGPMTARRLSVGLPR